MRLAAPTCGWSVLPRLLRRAHQDARPAKIHYIQLVAGRASPLPTSGAEGIRTPDLRRAKAALSQLSYGPAPWCVVVSRAGGPAWNRTRDLSLIRTAL